LGKQAARVFNLFACRFAGGPHERVATARCDGRHRGLGFASLMQFLSFSTTNFQSFSELAFGFTLNPEIVIKALLFSLLMGFIDSFLPALRAARMQIVDALRGA
jgi:putative ABC transport system permease protein